MKKYNKTGILLTGILVVLATMLVSVQPVMSANNATDVSATVTVNSDIDVTLNVSTLTFGSLDPGATNSGATNDPINVTVHSTTNADVNLSVNGDANFVSGGNTIAIANLDYSNETSGTYTDMTTSYAQGTGVYDDWADISDPSADTYRTMYFQIDIPSGQAAGAYSATVSVKVGEGAP